MSTLAPNASIGRTEPPDDAALSEALGATKSIWDGLIAKLDAEYGVSVREWKSYSAKSGWSLRLLKKKRTIVWMVPCEQSFRIAFVFGDKAVAAAAESGLPQKILTMLDEAEKYPEGTGIRLQIKSARDIPTVLKLAELKLKW